MHLNIAWLERVMGEARETGALAVGLDIPAQARLVLATLQGALLTARALGTDEPFELAVAALTRSFGWESPPCH
jgi:TetR/AcrR family transcriptional repressor of nem operon